MCSMRMEKNCAPRISDRGVYGCAPCAWKNGNWDGKGRDPGTHHSIRMEGQQPLQRVPHTWISFMRMEQLGAPIG